MNRRGTGFHKESPVPGGLPVVSMIL